MIDLVGKGRVLEFFISFLVFSSIFFCVSRSLRSLRLTTTEADQSPQMEKIQHHCTYCSYSTVIVISRIDSDDHKIIEKILTTTYFPANGNGVG